MRHGDEREPHDEHDARANAYVVPAGHDALVARMLTPLADAGWRLVVWGARPAFIQALYQRDADGARRAVRLVHPSVLAGSRPSAVTAQFRVVSAADDEAARALLACVAAAVARAEGAWRWARAGGPRVRADAREHLAQDIEVVALRAGLRAGVRATVAGAEVPAAIARYEREGLVVRVGGEVAFGGVPRATLYIARDDAGARALEQAERAFADPARFALDPGARVAADRELGALLGYPACCTAAFTERAWRSQDSAWHAARDAWVARPAPRLNNLLAGEGVRWISFEPCRYDCAAARAVADATADALARARDGVVDLARIDVALAVHVALAPSGARARVTTARDAESASVVVRGAAPVRRLAGVPLRDEDHAFAASLLGARVAGEGAIEGVPGALWIAFGE